MSSTYKLVLAPDGVTLYHGDCVEVMAEMPDASVDAVATDPPYELDFMSKGWDRSGVALSVLTWERALRVLKPGGHLLAFGGTRTWHRLAVAIEDAGFEVRDSIAWMYGSGFPKSLDVSKAIDKAAGAQREVVGSSDNGIAGGTGKHAGEGGVYGFRGKYDITAPATPEAEKWQGWGTALKPAFEPIVVARKPLIGTVAANVLEHGTGAINVDACRVGTGGQLKWERPRNIRYHGGSDAGTVDALENPAGRWPANVVLDESQAAELDKQSGERPGGNFPDRLTGSSIFGLNGHEQMGRSMGDTGGASRFFYVAKAPQSERPRAGEVAHPTVKPVELMRWLVRLVTPPGGTVLDPFAGSGTTLEACMVEGFECIGVELTADYLGLIRQRLAKPIQPTILSGAF